jgi:hypothetical protein
MTTKNEAQEKITRAELATDSAVMSWRSALAALDGDISANGHGVLRDPSALQAKLLEAKKHIENSLLYLDGVQWPTNADYDRV